MLQRLGTVGALKMGALTSADSRIQRTGGRRAWCPGAARKVALLHELDGCCKGHEWLLQGKFWLFKGMHGWDELNGMDEYPNMWRGRVSKGTVFETGGGGGDSRECTALIQ